MIDESKPFEEQIKLLKNVKDLISIGIATFMMTKI